MSRGGIFLLPSFRELEVEEKRGFSFATGFHIDLEHAIGKFY